MKKMLTLLLVLFMLIGNGYAEEPEYDFDTNDYAITTYRGAGGDITVPDVMEGCPVEMIESAVFYCNKEIRSIILPETLLAIGSSNFYAMDELQSVVLPEALIAIDAFNFFWCPQIAEVTIPASVCYIGNDCFEDCENLRTIRFLGEVPVMGLCCFEYLPEDAVAYVPDDRVEEYRAALPRTLAVLPSGQNVVTVDYTASEEKFEFDAETRTIIEYLGFATRVDIPETIGGVSVNVIGDEAFFGNNYMYYVTVPEGVVSIGENAFASATHLSYADLPSTLQSIGDSAFYGFKGQVLKLPEGLKTIGNEAFYWSNTEEVYFPSTIESIGEAAFGGSYVGYLYFEGKQLPEIAEDAFEGLEISDIDINWQATREQMQDAQAYFDSIGLETRVWRLQNPYVDYIIDGLDAYEDGVMTGYDGNQTHIRPWDTFEDITVTALGDGAFKGNKIIEYFAVPYSDEFTTIGNEAFADSNVKYVDLFDSVTTIGTGAFRNCANLKEIVIPASVTSIAADAFEGCTGLEKITFLCDISLLTEGMLDSCTNLVEYNGVPGANEDEKFALRVALYGMPEVKITRQPEDITVPEGETAEISLEVAGEGELIYAWYVMDIWSNEFTLDESCNTNAYSLIMDSDTDCTEVYCVVTDRYGTSATSDTAMFIMAEPEMPEPVAIGEEGKPFFGLWKVQTMEIEGMVLDAAELGVIMDLTLNEDGTASMFDGETTDVGVWTLEDGIANLMGMALTLTDDGRLCMAEEGSAIYFGREGDEPSGAASEILEPIAVGEEGKSFCDTWTLQSMEIEGMVLDVAELGMVMTITLNEDGTAVVFDGEGAETCSWFLIDGVAKLMDTDFVLTEDGMLCASDGDATMNFVRGGEAPSGMIPPVGELKNIAETEAFFGVWNGVYAEAEGQTLYLDDFGMEMVLCVYPDGTASMYDGESIEETFWMFEDGIMYIDAMVLNVTDEGLCITEDGALMYFEFAADVETLPGTVLEEPAQPVEGTLNDFVGIWTGSVIETEGVRFKLSEFEMVMEVTLNADGTCMMFDGMEEINSVWTVEDGVAVIEGMQLVLMNNGTLCMQDGDAQIVFTGYTGEWHMAYIATGGMMGDPREMFGLNCTLILNADGTGCIDFPDETQGIWYLDEENGNHYFVENEDDAGMLLTLLRGGFLKYGSDIGGYMVFSQAENALWDPSMYAYAETVNGNKSEAPSSGDTIGSNEERLNRKFICESYTAMGNRMDAATLGSEYSLLFYEDGTMDFCLAGTVIPKLAWGLNQVSIGLNKVDAFVINYYGTAFNAVLTDTGFDMDYGSITLHFVPAE